MHVHDFQVEQYACSRRSSWTQARSRRSPLSQAEQHARTSLPFFNLNNISVRHSQCAKVQRCVCFEVFSHTQKIQTRLPERVSQNEESVSQKREKSSYTYKLASGVLCPSIICVWSFMLSPSFMCGPYAPIRLLRMENTWECLVFLLLPHLWMENAWYLVFCALSLIYLWRMREHLGFYAFLSHLRRDGHLKSKSARCFEHFEYIGRVFDGGGIRRFRESTNKVFGASARRIRDIDLEKDENIKPAILGAFFP